MVNSNNTAGTVALMCWVHPSRQAQSCTSSVLISGVAQETYDRLAESIAKGLASRVAGPLREGITLVPATTGDRAALIGAGYNWLLQPHD